MASLGRIAGGIAMSPLRLAGGIAKLPFRAAAGAAKMGYRGAKAGLSATAMAAMDVTGAMPIFAAAAGLAKGAKKGISAGYESGKKLLRPIGEGAVDEQSAHDAIAAAASETSKIQAETEKIEAETRAITGEEKAGKDKAVAKTTMGGVDVEILEKIYGEVVSVRGILGGKDPESEKKELALDEQTRHKKFLKALAALGFDGGDDDKDKGPGLLGNLTDMFKGFLPLLIGGLGLAGLVTFWPKLSSAFEGISDAISNINEFLDDMAAFFKPLTDILGGADPSTLAAAAGAAKGTQRGQSRRGSGSKAAMDAERARSKQLKKEQKAKDKLRDKRIKKQEADKRKAAKEKAKLKAKADAEKARLKKIADAEKAQSKRLKFDKANRASGGTVKPTVKSKVGKSWKADKVPTRAVTKPTVGKSWKADKVPTKGVVKPTVGKSWKADKVPTRAPAPVVEKIGKSWKADKVPTRAPAPVVEKIGKSWKADKIPTRVAAPVVSKPMGGRSGAYVKPTSVSTVAALLDDTKKPTSTKPQKIPGWKAATSMKPFVNPVTQKPMSSRYYYRPDTGRWHDVTKTKGSMVKGVTVTEYMKKMGFEFKPDKANFKLTAAQRAFMGEKPNFVNRMQGSMKWLGKAAGPLAIVFIGYAIKNAFEAWKASPETIATGDKWPFNDSTEADTRFKLDMAALAASFGVGWVAAILGGSIGTTIGGPIGGFLGGLAFGVGAGLAADKVTRWLLGEEVDTREKKRRGIEDAAMHSRNFLTGHVSNKQADLDKAIAKETDEGGWFGIGAYTQEDKMADIQKAAIALAAAKTHAASETKRIDETERTALDKLDVQDQESLQKMQQGVQPSTQLLPGSDLMPTEMGDAAKAGGIGSSGRFDTGKAEGARMSDTIKSDVAPTGAALTALGKNGGQLSADVVITNINSTTNSDHQQVSSTSSTSNVITLDKAPSYSPMRSRFAV